MPSIAPSLVAARRALSVGEPSRTLALVGRASDPSALVLRGIAYAQLGQLARARLALERAAVARAPDVRARAKAALVVVRLEAGDLALAAKAAKASIASFDRRGDRHHATLVRLVLARIEVLLGRPEAARRLVDEPTTSELEGELSAVASLTRAEIALRAVRTTEARAALSKTRRALEATPSPLLARALVDLERELSLPVALAVRGGARRPADAFVIEALSGGDVLLVDTCASRVVSRSATISLADQRPLLGLLTTLSLAWPRAVSNDTLWGRVSRSTRDGRRRRAAALGPLRRLVARLDAKLVSGEDECALASKQDVALLLPASEDDASRIALALADGAAWSVEAVSARTGLSEAASRRALAALVRDDRALRLGKGKAARFARPGGPIAAKALLRSLF